MAGGGHGGGHAPKASGNHGGGGGVNIGKGAGIAALCLLVATSVLAILG